ncbi:methionine--tRNA ligase, mitochondrial [Pelobates cultripes]|uniref:Methionine--tRNA ligase, mitochondrial n=1 Tax=Pelobates cultripes TaxID=61616 RepID=A0AAD1WL80_PELCU|nr:methionine--tRNA ligase, mitochondrial [Pelobates cultripes]
MWLQRSVRQYSRTIRLSSEAIWPPGAPQSQPHLITTPIFYVNAAPHLGHVYSVLQADAQHRYAALYGEKTRLSTGTDEHGMKVQQAAESLGKDPYTFCTSVSHQFRAVFDALDISYTDFVRTSESRHAHAVNHVWLQLEEKGYIYKGTYHGWYCTSDEAFLSDGQTAMKTDDKGNQIRVSLESGHQVHWMSEENYMFRLSTFRPLLLRWLQTEPVRPANFQRIVSQWLEDELPDLSVSRQRSRLTWGIPVPSDPSHTIYVWFDALVNYLTASGYPNPHLAPWGPSTHILGKDILRFHAVYWPAFLLAAGLTPPRTLLVHSHWTCGGVKMSKSLQNVVDPIECVKSYTKDGLRYFLLRSGAPDHDCDFNHYTVRTLLNSELADALGGLLNRCTAHTINPMQRFPYYNPDSIPSSVHDQLQDLLRSLLELPAEVHQWVEKFQVNKALEAIDAKVRQTNAFFQSQAPWKLYKGNNKEVAWAESVLYISLEAMRLYATLLQPAVPGLANVILNRLGVSLAHRTLKENHFLNAALGRHCCFQGQSLGPDCGLLFPRLEKKDGEEQFAVRKKDYRETQLV